MSVSRCAWLHAMFVLASTYADEDDIVAGTKVLAETLRAQAPSDLVWFYRPMPAEHHDTIYRASAPDAFRTALGRHVRADSKTSNKGDTR